MQPRDDDQQLYRENVYKSWLIMSYVVRHIKNQCYVAHSDAPVGVGYDNLVLVTVSASGSTHFKFAMNRNGVNSTVVDRKFDLYILECRVLLHPDQCW